MTNQQTEQKLIVPIANPETVDTLFDTAIDIARGHSMSIVAVTVIEVPNQLPLDAGDELLTDEQEQLLDYATELGTDFEVDIESKVRYARDTATGIVGSVDAYDGDAILMGWRGRPRRRDVILGSFLDRVLGEAACDVYVQRIKYQRSTPDSILVPVAGGPHDDLAAEVAGIIAAQHDATITLLHVEHPDTDAKSHENHASLLDERRDRIPEDVPVEKIVLQHDHVAGAITDETTQHELTVLGAKRDPFLKRKLVGSVAQGVGRSAGGSVLVTRRHVDKSQ